MYSHDQANASGASRNGSAILAGLVVFALCIVVAEFMLRQEWQRKVEVERQQVTSLAGEVRALLETELNTTLYLTSGLITYVQARDGQLQASEVDPWLHGLIEQGQHIRNIGIAPGNRITYIYPQAGNEAALGFYYPDSPAQWPAVEKVIKERHPVLAGPLKLKQGGNGLIYRVPVFLSNDQYWGIISTVIDADKLLDVVTRAAQDKGLNITLAQVDDQGKVQKMIIGDSGDFDRAIVQLRVAIPGSQWDITATPNESDTSNSHFVSLRVFGWTVAVTISMLIYLLLSANTRRALALRALNESQQRFTRAFETAHQGMALLSLQGEWLNANDALCHLLSYSRDELRSMNLQAIAHCHTPDRDKPDIAALLSEAGHGSTHEICLTSKSGELIDCLLSMAEVDGQPPYLIAQIQDIREYKRLDRMKSEFVSTINHELRTPLTSISGSLGLITGGALGDIPPKMQEMIEVAHKNSIRLGQLINDLLDMDKLIAGKMNFELKPQPLLPQLEKAIAYNTPYADNLCVRLRLTGSEPVHVRVDDLRLQQVLSNYLSNAAKFAPAGSSVDITATTSDSHVRVSVSDKGPGVPEEFRERIFQKFSQADTSDTRHKGGTGLGLVICQELITHMGGSVGFEASPGEGSTFWFELPIVEPGEQ